MEKSSFSQARLYNISRRSQILEYIFIATGAFLVPLFLPNLLNIIFGSTSTIAANSQFVVGTIVNCSLIISGVNLKGFFKITSVVTLPSLAAVAGGVIFASPVYALYMIPGIWLGNFMIVLLFKSIYVQNRNNYFFTAIIAVCIKVAIIFAVFNILTLKEVIPNDNPITHAMFAAMGANQLVTAVLGTILAFSIIKIAYNKNNKTK